MLRLYGWLLFVTGCLLTSLLVILQAGTASRREAMNAVSPIPVPSGLEPASGHAVAIGADASLSDVIEAFRGNPELRLLAILDERRAPVGIIREQRV